MRYCYYILLHLILYVCCKVCSIYFILNLFKWKVIFASKLSKLKLTYLLLLKSRFTFYFFFLQLMYLCVILNHIHINDIINPFRVCWLLDFFCYIVIFSGGVRAVLNGDGNKASVQVISQLMIALSSLAVVFYT